MRNLLLILFISFLLVQCSQERERRNFFNELKGYPSFSSSKMEMPLFGLDSLIIDSLSTSIEGKNYWYMNTAADGLFNVNGYIRNSGKIIYVRAGDKSRAKISNEQILFDFSGDTTKNWIVQ